MIVDILFILKFNARLRLVRSSSLRFQVSTQAATRSFWLVSLCNWCISVDGRYVRVQDNRRLLHRYYSTRCIEWKRRRKLGRCYILLLSQSS